ncbi:MAG: arginine deiminase-related protein [Balneolales bacterium]
MSSSLIENTKASVITHVSELGFFLNQVSDMPSPGQILMVQPTHYSIDYVINPHMEGNEGTVDKKKALQEWGKIRDTFKSNGLKVQTIEGQPGMPDMVFCANQSLPYVDENGNKKVIMSIMRSEHRKNEVPFIEQWYRQNGYQVIYIDPPGIESFEGMGDAIWHNKRRLLWGGYGYRTSSKAYDFISRTYNVPVITLELNNPFFYHLDTCFCILNEDTVLIYPKAFTRDSLDLVQAVFKNIIEADTKAAEQNFACNATSDGTNVVIQKGSNEVKDKLKLLGFNVQEVETGEFIKSGGSVFCMKCVVW